MNHVFKNIYKGIGCHRFRQIKLDVDKNVKPVVQARRRIPFAKLKQLEELLEELEKEDIVEDVQGPTEWISNLVLTPKADSKMRMNIDMTTMNEAIKRTRHVIPTVEDLIIIIIMRPRPRLCSQFPSRWHSRSLPLASLHTGDRCLCTVCHGMSAFDSYDRLR